MKPFPFKYCIALALIIWGCNSGVVDESIKPENLVSITSFISPQDTMLTANVFYAQEIGSVIETQSSAVKDALVTISDDQSADTLMYIDVKQNYEKRIKNIVVQATGRYQLNVILSNGKKLSSECIVPLLPDAPELNGVREGDDFNFVITWNNSNLQPYYLLSSIAIGTYQVTNPRGTFTTKLFAQLDGGSFILGQQNGSNNENGEVSNAFRAADPRLEILLRNIDYNTYMFYSSIMELDEWDSNTENFIPNFRDPKTAYSNIDGGVGVFGALNLNRTIYIIN